MTKLGLDVKRLTYKQIKICMWFTAISMHTSNLGQCSNW